MYANELAPEWIKQRLSSLRQEIRQVTSGLDVTIDTGEQIEHVEGALIYLQRAERALTLAVRVSNPYAVACA